MQDNFNLFIEQFNQLFTIPSYGVIYKINFPNGKCYIGQTIIPRERFLKHISSASRLSTPCACAIVKFKTTLKNFEIISHAYSKFDLNKQEVYFIKYFNSQIDAKNSNGYNCDFGGRLNKEMSKVFCKVIKSRHD